jgi:DNA-binding MarR family transcriptional regulator
VARTGGIETAEVVGEQLSRDVLRHLLGVMHAMKDHVAGLGAAFDLTPSQLTVLRLLGQSRSQRELADCMHVDASNVTDIVDRLEQRGLAVRTVDPSDRRIRRIVLTAEGEELQRNLFKQALATAPISSLDPREQRTLCDLLGRIAEPADLPF